MCLRGILITSILSYLKSGRTKQVTVTLTSLIILSYDKEK